MNDPQQPEDQARALTPAELDERAATSYEKAGRWLAATFDLDTLGDQRDAMANAESWAAHGLQAERHAARIRKSTEENDNG